MNNTNPSNGPGNPVNRWLRTERMPHIWCPGCGIGTTVNCFVRALDQLETNPDDLAVVSGIGCTGRVAGYMAVDSFHTTHGRAIPFATGLKLARPEKKVVVYSGDGDMFAIGGNHFIHAARRNLDMTVICVNNLTYAMTGGQVGPTTPETAHGTTAPYGAYDHPFNLPYLAESCGAVYVARWTSFHVRQITKSMKEALQKSGFCFIEILSPCPTLYQRRNRMGDGLTAMRGYKEFSRIENGAKTADVDVHKTGEIVCGKFVDLYKVRPTFLEAYNQQNSTVLGESFVPYDGGCNQ